MHDIISNIAVQQVLAPQSITAAACTSGDIDCQGVGTVAVAVLLGSFTDTLDDDKSVTLTIEHADALSDGSAGAYTACVDADVIGATLDNGVFAVIDDNDKTGTRHAIGYRGTKRFLKVTATPAGLSAGGTIAMIALGGNTAQKPVANA